MEKHLKTVRMVALIGAMSALSTFASAAERHGAQCSPQDKAASTATRLHGCSFATYGLTPLGAPRTPGSSSKDSSSKGGNSTNSQLADSANTGGAGSPAGAPGGKPIEDPPLPPVQSDAPALASASISGGADNARGSRNGGTGKNH